jgi:quercetin dioxygenase-like cupin family protein
MSDSDAEAGVRDGEPLAHDDQQNAAAVFAFPPGWVSREQLPSFSPLPGFTMQSVTGGKLMANWVVIEPHREMPLHHHPHEQLGIMLEGAMELTIGDETRLLRAGDAYTIPPHLPHYARTHDEGCVVLDVFTPPREDYGPRE